MKQLKILLMLLLLMTAATGAWAIQVYPKYLVIDMATGNHRYTNDGPDLTKDLCRKGELWLRYIPAGTFKMGSATTEPGYNGCENQHWVKLTKPFYIGVFECTQFQWKAIMGSFTTDESLLLPSWFNNGSYWETRPVERVSYEMIRGGNKGTGWPDNDDVDANSFMGILRTTTAMKFDLPTEAQWEYACRAGTTTALNSGTDLTNEDKDDAMVPVGRYYYNGGMVLNGEEWKKPLQSCDATQGTAKVGSYAPNAWDLYDMHGNVLEWCLDWNYSNDYPVGTETDPVVDPVGESYVSEYGDTRAVRGGDWSSPASGCRSAYRGATQDNAAGADCGFRIVCLTMPDPELLYTLTVTNGTTANTSVYAGETVTITANNPPTGQVFDKWTSSDGVTFADATSATTTFTMLDKDVTVTATYKDSPKYKVTVRGGTADKEEAYDGETVTISAEAPEPGMVFDHWWDGNLQSPLVYADENAPTTTFVMPARDVLVSSVYSGAPESTYAVTVVNGISDKWAVTQGETVTITANNPPTGLVFDKWTSSDGVTFADATSATTTFTMLDKNVTVTATYRDPSIPTHSVKMKDGTKDAANWTIASGQTSVTGDNAYGLTGVAAGTQVTATYNGTKKVKSVKAASSGAQSPIDLTPNNDATIWTLTSMTEYNAELEVIYKIDLTLTVNIEGWTYGSTPNKPTVNGNAGNGTVTYEYKQKGAADNTYTTDVPTAAGGYTVRATVAETADYASGTATADFTIGQAPATPTIDVTANLANGAYWATFYTTDGNYQAPTGTKVYTITLNGTKLTMNEISNSIVQSGQGVVLKKATTATEPTAITITMTKTETNSSLEVTNSLKGTLTGLTGNGTIYVLNSGTKGAGFYKLADNGTLPANKAYLEYDGAAGARDFFLFDETTAVSASLVNSEERIVNSEVYDLQGRRVKATTKGVYIVNGRKVVVK